MYLLYGAGKIGLEFVHKCKNNGINDLCITDTNKKLIGTSIEGFKIKEFEKINLSEIELIIITTSRLYYDEIKSIIKKRFDKTEIIFHEYAIFLTESDSLYLGSISLNSQGFKAGIYSYRGITQLFNVNSFNDLERFLYLEDHKLIHKYVHYTEAYDRFFFKYRNRKVKVLEIGVFKGGSLQMWKNYFGKEAEIIGVDIDPECKKYEEKGIQVYIGDQEERDFLRFLKKSIGKVDIIIDDGGHTMKQQIVTFEELFDILDEDGVYLCEDLHTSYWAEYGGGYKNEDTFIEYSKRQIDSLNDQYFDSENILFPYRGKIKSITYYDSMVFFEKKKFGNKSLALKIEKGTSVSTE